MTLTVVASHDRFIFKAGRIESERRFRGAVAEFAIADLIVYEASARQRRWLESSIELQPALFFVTHCET